MYGDFHHHHHHHRNHSSTKLVTPPACEPVSVQEMKDHLRIDGDDEDPQIASWITSARLAVEQFTGRQLITASWRLNLDRFPGAGVWFHYLQVPCNGQWLLLPSAPLASIDSITYVGMDGTTQTWDSSLYIVDADSEPARLTPVYGQFWPFARHQINAVTINFTSGYGTADIIPDTFKSAIKLQVADLYQNRENVLPARIPKGASTLLLPVERLLWPTRVFI